MTGANMSKRWTNGVARPAFITRVRPSVNWRTIATAGLSARAWGLSTAVHRMAAVVARISRLLGVLMSIPECLSFGLASTGELHTENVGLARITLDVGRKSSVLFLVVALPVVAIACAIKSEVQNSPRPVGQVGL